MIWFLRALPINCQALGGALAYLYTLAKHSQNCPKNNLVVVDDQNKGLGMVPKSFYVS